jgi:hypothetical protein
MSLPIAEPVREHEFDRGGAGEPQSAGRLEYKTEMFDQSNRGSSGDE